MYSYTYNLTENGGIASLSQIAISQTFSIPVKISNHVMLRKKYNALINWNFFLSVHEHEGHCDIKH